jgi:hypothetical protein
VVAAGLILVSEPDRPEHVRLSGIALAFAATLLFTSRDNLVRWYSQRDLERLGPGAAVAIGAGFICLLAAYYRVKVTVVPPRRDRIALGRDALRPPFQAGRARRRAARVRGDPVLAGGTLISLFR